MSNLSTLKVGDAVIIFDSSGFGLPGISRSEITEITKGGNFRIKGSDAVWNTQGRQRGAGAWSRVYFEPFDQTIWDDLKARHQERRDRKKMAEIDFQNLPIDTVRKLLDVLEQDQTKGGNESNFLLRYWFCRCEARRNV